MKKMIPVYVLQIAMLATLILVSVLVLRKMDSIKTELKTELAVPKAESGVRQPRGGSAVRVIVMNPVEVTR